MMNEWVEVIKEVEKLIVARDETHIQSYASLVEQQQKSHQQDTLVLANQLAQITEQIRKTRLRPTQRLPEFDGTNLNINDWEEKVKEIVNANEWDIGLILVYLPLSLKGQAKQSFQNLRKEDLISKESLIQALKSRLDPNIKTRNKESLVNAKKLPGESMASFIDRCKTLVKRSGGDTEENLVIQLLKDKVVENIQPMDRRLLHVKVLPSDELDKFVDIGEVLCGSETDGLVREVDQPERSDMIHSERIKVNSLQEVEPQKKKVGPCGKCHQWGHTRRYCPKRMQKDDS